MDFCFLYKGALPHQATFIKTDLFNQYGLYDETLKVAADWEKWIVFILLHHCSYKHLDFLCSVFNLNGISSTNPALCARERKAILNKYFSSHEIRKIKNIVRNHGLYYTFTDYLFSIKKSLFKKHLIITIFGLKIKI